MFKYNFEIDCEEYAGSYYVVKSLSVSKIWKNYNEKCLYVDYNFFKYMNVTIYIGSETKEFVQILKLVKNEDYTFLDEYVLSLIFKEFSHNPKQAEQHLIQCANDLVKAGERNKIKEIKKVLELE